MHSAKRGLFLILCLALFLIYGSTLPTVRAQSGSETYVPFVSSGAVSPTTTALPGEASDPVTAAIPQLDFTPRPEDYSDEHPELGGLMISFNTLYLIFSLDTTVGEANAILDGLGATIVGGMPGVVGQSEGVLVLRLSTNTHEAMIAAIEELYSHPQVEVAVQDSLMEVPEPQPDSPEVTASNVSKPNGSAPANWTWQVTPAGDNWGLELIRVPQLWNFNHAVTKQGTLAITGVLDNGFNIAHPDLIYLENLSPGAWADHGTHVAGTIGATFNNGVGIDGINPFAFLVVKQSGRGIGWGLTDFLIARSDLQVVNISMGYNWSQLSPPINPNANTRAQNLAKDQARVFVYVQKLIGSANERLPLIVVSAGNDSNSGLGNVEARWNSPFAYAALALNVENIMVVEALQLAPGVSGGATRAPYSNLKRGDDRDAAVSAPGTGIMSTLLITPYGTLNGTSMAAPHVAGLVSYLLSLEPTVE